MCGVPIHSISGIFNGKSISTKLNRISFNTVGKESDSKLKLDGLDITGQQLKVKDNNLNLSVAAYDITDNKISSFREITYKANNGKIDC